VEKPDLSLDNTLLNNNTFQLQVGACRSESARPSATECNEARKSRSVVRESTEARSRLNKFLQDQVDRPATLTSTTSLAESEREREREGGTLLA